MSVLTDTGHHNCRDYYLPLPRPATTHTIPPALSMTQTAAQILRLYATQKSPLNQRPNKVTFPFLRLPYELRRKVYSYLLPYTETKSSSGSLIPTPTSSGNAASTAHKIHLASLPSAKYTANTTLWHRGQTSLLAVNKQLHTECAELLYGENNFVLWVSYDVIQFRFRWVLASGLAPSCAFDFLTLLGATPYLGLIRRVIVTVDVVDEYTGMIKFNVGGGGLVYGLKLQVKKLVRALKEADGEGVRRLTVRLHNGSDGIAEGEKKMISRSRDNAIRSLEDVQGVLAPLRELKGVREVMMCGAITEAYKEDLRKSMIATP
ncbi:hypothetical protein E4T39_02074 [Aureobasidium subglaciale]|nr:hypothetical protein E4T39_02074 [Aureobasidium subglaciale]